MLLSDYYNSCEMVASMLAPYGKVELDKPPSRRYPSILFKPTVGGKLFHVEVKHVKFWIHSGDRVSEMRRGRLKVRRSSWDNLTSYTVSKDLERLLVVILDGGFSFLVFPTEIIDKKLKESGCECVIFSHTLFDDVCMNLQYFLKTYGFNKSRNELE